MSSSERSSVFKEDHDKMIENEVTDTRRDYMYMPILPSTFKSLVGKAVKIEIEEPRYVIELLGDLLGVTDYKTNKAAFWFLDTIALQVLRYKHLDDHYKGVLISWLAGEMKLIRDKKLCRENFIKEMRTLFLSAEKLFSDDQLPYWELLVDERSEIISKNLITDKLVTNRAKYLITNESSKEELMAEDNERASRENKHSFVEKNSNNYNYGSVTNNEEKPKNIELPLSTENSQTDTFTDANTINESSNLKNPSIVLDMIIEATYSMYANELRYALIHAVFVMPIQIKIFHMPHTLRKPRQIKLADEKGSFDMQLCQRLERTANELTSRDRNGKKYKEKEKTNNIKEERTVAEDLNMEIPPTPRPSFSEDEALANNRRFILPLIEAKEATRIFEMHTGDT
ncbi:uncharacterized protein [Linepithema humile]|uniref:uncharacterized protein isoform X2 n=1 Tax=Linepithema humile TaxID=83485 RepID=UPI00351ECF0D